MSARRVGLLLALVIPASAGIGPRLGAQGTVPSFPLGTSPIALMTTNQTGTLFSQTGQGFGLGFQVLLTPGADGRPESVGTFSWGGAYGSQYEVDPKERLVLVYMVQLLPSRSTLGARFPMLVYQALVQPAK